MLPNGVDFTALDQKITQDTEDSSTGIVTYSYDGHELGTAKVKLSKSYLKAHTDSTQDESKSSGHDNSKNRLNRETPVTWNNKRKSYSGAEHSFSNIDHNIYSYGVPHKKKE